MRWLEEAVKKGQFVGFPWCFLVLAISGWLETDDVSCHLPGLDGHCLLCGGRHKGAAVSTVLNVI